MGTLWTTRCMIAARVSCVLHSEARLTGILFTETTEWSPVGPWGPDTKWLWQNCTAPDPAPGFPSPPRLCWEKPASPSAPLSGQCSLKRGKPTIEKNSVIVRRRCVVIFKSTGDFWHNLSPCSRTLTLCSTRWKSWMRPRSCTSWTKLPCGSCPSRPVATWRRWTPSSAASLLRKSLRWTRQHWWLCCGQDCTVDPLTMFSTGLQ